MTDMMRYRRPIFKLPTLMKIAGRVTREKIDSAIAQPVRITVLRKSHRPDTGECGQIRKILALIAGRPVACQPT